MDTTYLSEETRTYRGAGTIQFYGRDINDLEGGADQPRTGMYKFDLPEGETIAGHLGEITGPLYWHAQERAQESGQAVAVGLIKAEWPGEITGLFIEMLWYCAGPSVLAAEYADVYGLMQQWATVPKAYSGVYVRHLGPAKYEGGILEAAAADLESIERGVI